MSIKSNNSLRISASNIDRCQYIKIHCIFTEKIESQDRLVFFLSIPLYFSSTQQIHSHTHDYYFCFSSLSFHKHTCVDVIRRAQQYKALTSIYTRVSCHINAFKPDALFDFPSVCVSRCICDYY